MSDADFQIEIDGRSVPAQRGEMIIQVADREGITIPRFCYHEKLSVAANCRMCLVEVERAPKPLPACATPVMDGMKITTASDYARQAQRSVMEFLLINHPLDCPICDQGGECELQDLAIGYGEGVSRFNDRKRVVKDKYIGPLIATDMTRCIHCTRCIRFGEEIGGMPELGATGRGENMEIGTYIEKSIDSELSGNVIDVCPVGALTSRPFRFRARSWEMQSREALAPHDGVGSNVFVHIAQRKIMRVVPRRNDDVNEAWISDRDRFSYEALYSDERLARPAIKVDGEWRDVDWEDALNFVAEGLSTIANGPGADQIGVLAAPNATAEEHFLLQKLARALGCNNLDHRLRYADLSDGQPLTHGLGMALADVAGVGGALVVGTNTRKAAPMLNHRLHMAAKQGASIHFLNAEDYPQNFSTGPSAVRSPRDWSAALAEVLAAVAAMAGKTIASLDDVQPGEWAQSVAATLSAADSGLLLLGEQALAHPHAASLRRCVAQIAELTNTNAGTLALGANGAGATLAGMLPDFGPGATPTSAKGLNARQMIESPRKAYVLFGMEPELDCIEGRGAKDAIGRADLVINFTAFDSASIREDADVLLPIGLFAETDGTLVNAEGRWQMASAAVAAPGSARPAWKILRVLGNLLELDGFDYMRSDSVTRELRDAVGTAQVGGLNGGHEGLVNPDLGAKSLWRCSETPIYSTDALVRRAPALQRTPDAAMPIARMNAAEAEKQGLVGADAVQVTGAMGTVQLPVEIDARVADGVVCIPAGLCETAALGAANEPVAVEPSTLAQEA
jgi:NADH-quinone oxidoreductase subunit G